MSRIRMAIEIHNDLPQTLRFDRAELAHGSWTDPWMPPATIAPGTTAEFRAEGAMILGAPTTGTEGRVWYNIDGDVSRQLYVHFNSPLIESQYGNTFHIWAPDGYQAIHHDGQGHNARLSIRLRASQWRAVPNFVPSVCGFRFSNSTWPAGLPVLTMGRIWNALLDTLPGELAALLGIVRADEEWLPVTEANQGLCGGMVFAVMDYAHRHMVPPANSAPPNAADDPLFRYLVDRLLDSFDVLGSGHRWLAYSSPHYPNGDEGFVQAVGLTRGRSWVSYREEWPRIRDDLDAGRLSPVGLVRTDTLDIGKNHQVLAYAYKQSGQRVLLAIYDPTYTVAGGTSVLPADNLVLTFDITSTSGVVSMQTISLGVAARLSGDLEVERASMSGAQPTDNIAFMRMDGWEPREGPGGRPGDALGIREALLRSSGRGEGVLPADMGAGRGDARAWMRSL